MEEQHGAAIAGVRVKVGELVSDDKTQEAAVGYSTPLTQALSTARVAAQAAIDAVPDSGYAETPSQRRKLDSMIGEAMNALQTTRATLKAKPEPGA